MIRHRGHQIFGDRHVSAFGRGRLWRNSQAHLARALQFALDAFELKLSTGQYIRAENAQHDGLYPPGAFVRKHDAIRCGCLNALGAALMTLDDVRGDGGCRGYVDGCAMRLIGCLRSAAGGRASIKAYPMPAKCHCAKDERAHPGLPGSRWHYLILSLRRMAAQPWALLIMQ